MPMNVWAEYVPSPKNPWTVAKVGHLYRRAAFGANWTQLHEGLKLGPKRLIDQILEGEQSEEFTKTSDFMASERSLTAGASGTQLSAWWLHRILNTPHPLQEKLSLFWHNHFATSLGKVQNARYMLGQYRLLNQHALGDFRELLKAMSTDPAMMIWLDTVTSTKGQPNENYARELMELFSLGIGHYSEKDIREAAKAFTGYELKAGKTLFNSRKHDDSEKAVLGQKGRWKADDIVRICLEQKACPKFIVTKLYRYLISESQAPEAGLIEPLAEQYRASGFDTKKLVETMLRSELFFSDKAYRQRVKSPVDFAVGIVKAVNGKVGALPLAEAIEPLGQILFAPPNVKGWDGGPVWLNAQTLLFRQNLALALTSTTDNRFGNRLDPVLAYTQQQGQDDPVGFWLKLFLQDDAPEARQKLTEYWKSSEKSKYPKFWSETDADQHRLRTLAHLTLTLPEFQLD
jgi:uncharacterized protein (DUF1800 family)